MSRPPSATSWAQRSTPLPMESSSPACRRRSISRLTIGGRPSNLAPSSRKYSLPASSSRSEEHTSELQSRLHLVCRLLLEKKNHHSRPRQRPPHIVPDNEALKVNVP